MPFGCQGHANRGITLIYKIAFVKVSMPFERKCLAGKHCLLTALQCRATLSILHACPSIHPAMCFTALMCMQFCKQPTQQLPAITSKSVYILAHRVNCMQVTVTGNISHCSHYPAALMLSSLQAYVHELSAANEWCNAYHHSHRQAELRHTWDQTHHDAAKHLHFCRTCI